MTLPSLRTLLRERGAAAAPLFILVLPALTAAVGLAVDGAAIQMERNRLQVAADAAATAGVRRIEDAGAAVIEAQRLAGLNMPANGTVLAAQDVQIGRWNAATRTFTPASGANANAVRVTTREAAANGNPYPLVFGKALGVETVDLSATATALCPENPVFSAVSSSIPSRTAVVAMGSPCRSETGRAGLCHWATPQGNPIIRIDNWHDGEAEISVRVISPNQHAQVFTFTAPRAGQYWVVVPGITMNAVSEGAPATNIVFRLAGSSPAVPASRIDTASTATYTNRFIKTATMPGRTLCAAETHGVRSTLVN